LGRRREARPAHDLQGIQRRSGYAGRCRRRRRERRDRGDHDRPILEWNRRRDFPDDVTVLEKVFARENYAIALPENSPLRLKIDQAMLDELRGPRWQAILQRYLGGGD
jgi:hypothetical protein